MNAEKEVVQKSRRDFIKNIAGASTLLFCNTMHVFPANPTEKPKTGPAELVYKYKTLSIKHLQDLKADMLKLLESGKLSNNETYLKYIKGFDYELPKTLPNAQSIIIVALPQRLARINCNFKGKQYGIMIPCGYVDDGLTLDMLKNDIMQRIIKKQNIKFERTRIPLKMTAVRSGLAEYGKNNITFIDGMGSFYQLIGLYTDHVFAEDHWDRLKMLRVCKGCFICMKACPTQCITEENFVINAGKCISLYNELPDPMPAWLDPKAHNALIGCLKCQYDCPANSEQIKNVEIIAELTEAETQFLLNGGDNKDLQNAIVTKLKRLGGGPEQLPYISRNFQLVFNAIGITG